MPLQSPRDMWQKLGAIREDIHPITLLLAGICIQSLLAVILPGRLVILPAVLWLLYRGSLAALVTLGYARNPYLQGAYLGGSQAIIPNKDGSIPENNTSPESGSDRGIVCFLVGWSINHPAGRFAPGVKATSEYWRNNWAEAEANPEKWGFLGKTSPLISRSDKGGTHIIAVSYWKDLEHLAAFSSSTSHRAGMQFVMTARGKYPHLGLMHETYLAPKGHWENLYYNSQPIGLGKTKHPIVSSTGDNSYMSSLVKARPGVGFKRLLSSTSTL